MNNAASSPPWYCSPGCLCKYLHLVIWQALLCNVTYKWESHTRSNLNLVSCPRTLQRMLWRSRLLAKKVYSSLNFSSQFSMKTNQKTFCIYFNLVLHYQCVSLLITQCSQEQSKSSLIPSTQKIIFLLILKEWLNGDKKLLYCCSLVPFFTASCLHRFFTDFHWTAGHLQSQIF